MFKFRRAFTFIEIMLVLTIIGIGVFALSPIISEKLAEGDEQLSFFNELLQQHYEAALEEGVPKTILGFKGSANVMTHEGKRLSIPGIKSIQSAVINDEDAAGLEYRLTVYPDGLCDHFIIETDTDELIESIPLMLAVKRQKK